jgi:uncharacterized membrane protein YedE/YeeE
MRVRLAAGALGVAFGFVISWGQFTNPDRIRQMLLLEDPYLYLMMATAIAIAMLGLRLLRHRGVRAILTRRPIAWETARPARRHYAGAAIFGLGWSLSDSCPAPIAAQLTQGVLWSLFTIAGIGIGILIYLRREERLAGARGAPPARVAPTAAAAAAHE